MKLSKPQIELLTHAVSAGKASCHPDYAPAKKLVSLGLATSHEGKWGAHHLEPTTAGFEEMRGHQQETLK